MSPRMPQTPVGEKRVLARLILSGKREHGVGFLTSDDFLNLFRKKIFEAYINVSRRLPEFDEIFVLNEAKLLLKGNETDQKQLEEAYNEVCSTQGTPDLDEEIANLKTYTRKRKLMEFSDQALQESKASDPNVTKLIDLLANLQAGGVKVKDFSNIVAENLELFKKRWEKGLALTGLTSTIPAFDEVTGGMQPGETIIIAGRPGAGKTSLMVQQALANAKLGKKILYFSLEMVDSEMMEKFISHTLKLDSRRISNPGDGAEGDMVKRRIENGFNTIQKYPITFVDNIFSINDIITASWFVKETTGLDAIFIDYLQLVDAGKKMFQSDNSSVSFVSRQLKMLAQQLKVPIFLGSQLSRKTDMREDQSPRLSDLRDSGSLEQDASLVMGLHYHEVKDIETLTVKGPDNKYTVKTNEKPTGTWKTTGIILLKNRRGRANFETDVEFDATTSTFSPGITATAISIFAEKDNDYALN